LARNADGARAVDGPVHGNRHAQLEVCRVFQRDRRRVGVVLDPVDEDAAQSGDRAETEDAGATGADTALTAGCQVGPASATGTQSQRTCRYQQDHELVHRSTFFLTRSPAVALSMVAAADILVSSWKP